MTSLFLESLLIGLAIAAPVGPIGMLCIQRTLVGGFSQALSVGLGAALADSVYGLIAAFGMSSLTILLMSYTLYIQTLGGLFLIALGIKEMRKKKMPSSQIHKHSVYDVFFLTLTNPMTILSFMGIFASLSHGPTSIYSSLIMVFGIFMGSMVWWCVLGGIVTSIKHKLPTHWIERISYASGLILICFGLVALLKR